jgi:transcriptional regulator with XRE-family HTH domain
LLPHISVGRNICRLRLKAALTQERLAERIGIDLRSLQRIEAGQWNMTVDYLDRIRIALGCKWMDLLPPD